MGKLQDFFMKNEIGAEVKNEVIIKPFPHPFIIHSITEAENKAIRKSCQAVSMDKKTHERRVDTNTDLYTSRLVVACCEEPNFKDAELQARHKVMGAEELLDKLLTPGQYTELMLAVQEICGFDADMGELVDEAKN